MFNIISTTKPETYGNGLKVNIQLQQYVDTITGKTFFHPSKDLQKAATIDFTPKTTNNVYNDRKVDYAEITTVIEALCISFLSLIKDIQLTSKYDNLNCFIGWSNTEMTNFLTKNLNFRSIKETLFITKADLVRQDKSLKILLDKVERLKTLKSKSKLLKIFTF